MKLDLALRPQEDGQTHMGLRVLSFLPSTTGHMSLAEGSSGVAWGVRLKKRPTGHYLHCVW